MKIDNAIQIFTETYSRDALASIDNLSKDVGLNGNHIKINLFDIQNSFDKFKSYIESYANYKILHKNDSKGTSQDGITEAVKRFIESKELSSSKSYQYKEIPSTIAAYIEGVQTLLETVDNVKNALTEADVDMEAVGYVNEYTDMFMEKVDSLLSSNMDTLLWASGWTAKQRLFNTKPKTNESKPIFL